MKKFLNSQIGTISIVISCASIGCKPRSESENDALKSLKSGGGQKAEFLCSGDYDAGAAAGALEYQLGSKLSTFVQVKSDKTIYVSDKSFPIQDLSHLQSEFEVAKSGPDWTKDAIKKSGIKNVDSMTLYQAPCENKSKLGTFGVEYCDKFDSTNFAFALSGKDFASGKVHLLRLNREFRAPHKIEDALNVAEYTCKAEDNPYGDDSVNSKILALREFFSVRNKEGKVLRSSYQGAPLGKMPNFKNNLSGGRGTKIAEDLSSPLGLLREQVYQEKAERNLAGLTPRDEFFVKGESKFHEEVNDLDRANSSKRQYGFMTQTNGHTAMLDAATEFEKVHSQKQGMTASISKRPDLTEMIQIFDALVREKNIQVGTFGGAKAACGKTSGAFVIVDTRPNYKISHFIATDFCPLN